LLPARLLLVLLLLFLGLRGLLVHLGRFVPLLDSLLWHVASFRFVLLAVPPPRGRKTSPRV
jgi:hypothetical protein